MQRYRKKPIEIDAFRWEPGVEFPSPAFDGLKTRAWVIQDNETHEELYLAIATLEGTMHANPGDWVIRGIQGEFYPCRPDIFAASYEIVEN